MQEKIVRKCPVCNKNFKPMTEAQWKVNWQLHEQISNRHKKYLALSQIVWNPDSANLFNIEKEIDRLMADEGEFIVIGILVFILGILLIVSPPIDNFFTTFTGLKGEKLATIAIICLLAGPSLAIVSAWSAKKSR